MASPTPHNSETTAPLGKAYAILSACALAFLGFIAGRDSSVFGRSSASLSSTTIIAISVIMAGSLIAAIIAAIDRQKAFNSLRVERDKASHAIASAEAAAAQFRRLKTQINQKKTLT
jgi:anti-sigma factor RsiW